MSNVIKHVIYDMRPIALSYFLPHNLSRALRLSVIPIYAMLKLFV